jgi:hypothetical protein
VCRREVTVGSNPTLSAIILDCKQAFFTMNEQKLSRLKRPVYPMPDFVRRALDKRELVDAYRNRPLYQQNDYIGWITRAKRKETQEKRLAQMLDELASGDRYMGMAYNARGFIK